MASVKTSLPVPSRSALLIAPLAGLLLAPALVAQQSVAAPPPSVSLADLRAGFQSPPPAARLRCYWWWLNGNTDKATITHDLEEMKSKGFGGALLVDANGANQNGNDTVPAGPTFGSPAWVDLYTHALREADRLGLEITLNITSGWNLGGPEVTPAQASKLLTWTRTQITGGGRQDIPLPAPTSHNGFYRQIAVLAYPLHNGPAIAKQSGPSLEVRSAAAETGFSMPDATGMLAPGSTAPADTALSEIHDLSASVRADGSLSWDVPAGQWEILRIGYTDSDARVSTASGTWQGLAIDYMSRDAFNAYWDHTVEPLLVAAKPFHSLKYLASDSWELHGTNWTDTFAAEFRQRRGYDPLPWLPVVTGRIVGDADRSTRFLTDLRRTVADLVVANHYDVFAARAAEHGMGVEAESGGPHGAPLDALETFRRSAVPQTEFWSINAHRATDVDRFFTKEGASAANIYGQRFVAQEGETSIGPQWSESLASDLKPSFDMGITEGMNRLVWHEFTSSPASTGLPGQEYFAGTHINPKVTWWGPGTAFFTYLNRVQFLMQQGTAVDDVLYFYGDNVPNFVRLKADDPAHVLPGYDYDVTNEDALLNTIHTNGGKLVGPSGVAWRALALPRSGRLSLPALERIAAYVKAGGTVIGNPPASSTGMLSAESQAAFAATVASVWGPACAPGSHHPYGSGVVFCTQDTHAALETMGIAPDVTPLAASPRQVASFPSAFDYIHRRIGTTEVYFVRNGSGQPMQYDAAFRSTGTAVALWDAVTGEAHRVAGTRPEANGSTRVPFALPAYGSAFLVFSPESATLPPAQPLTRRAEPLQLSAPWSISFQGGRGAPETASSATTLTSWTESPQPGVRYFSGTATYTARVTAPAFASGEQVLLHFADVREIARVKVNGQDAGTVWAQPLTLRVDPFLKPGLNTLEIEVTNLWPNRIIGDRQPGVQHPYTQTNITAYRADSPLLPSGLIGPVEWQIEK